MKAIIKRFVRDESGATAIDWRWHFGCDHRRSAGHRCKPERHVYGCFECYQIS